MLCFLLQAQRQNIRILVLKNKSIKQNILANIKWIKKNSGWELKGFYPQKSGQVGFIAFANSHS